MDIFSLVIIFFVISAVFRLIKKISTSSKQTQTQEQAEPAKSGYAPKPAPKPAPKREDYRFPPVSKPAPKPVFQEGGDPNAKMTGYTPITASSDLEKQFSQYEGSLDVSSTEGVGYEAEAYEPIDTAYQTDQDIAVKILPETFNRNALLQAVVMSEVLKRPETSR